MSDLSNHIFSESSWPPQSTDAPRWKKQWQKYIHKLEVQGGQLGFTKYQPPKKQISTAKAHIYKMTHFATKVRIFIMAGLLLLYILFSWRCMSNKIYIFGKKEASRVICGINEDHFNWGHLRKHSTAQHLYNHTALYRPSIYSPI